MYTHHRRTQLFRPSLAKRLTRRLLNLTWNLSQLLKWR